MRVLLLISAVALAASSAGAQSTRPRGIMLPTIPTVHFFDGRAELVPGVPLETWPTRAVPGRAAVDRQREAAARANAMARRACPIPTITGDTSARMPRVPGAGVGTGSVPMPVAAVRCIARIA